MKSAAYYVQVDSVLRSFKCECCDMQISS